MMTIDTVFDITILPASAWVLSGEHCESTYVLLRKFVIVNERADVHPGAWATEKMVVA
jgi:hypothetical protein